MKLHSAMVALAAFTFALGTARADENVAGKWKGQFDSQIGLQKYTYEFKVDGNKVTGKAIGERENGTNDVEITEGKIDKDQISFVEPLKFNDNDIRIEYTGKISGDEIKFTRKVGDFGSEEFVAKRVKESDAKPDAKSEEKSATKDPAAKP